MMHYPDLHIISSSGLLYCVAVLRLLIMCSMLRVVGVLSHHTPEVWLLWCLLVLLVVA